MVTTVRGLGWVVGTVGGLAVAGFVFHFPGSFGVPSWQPAAMIFGLLLGAISGAVVGVAQWVGMAFPRGRLLRLVGAMGIGVGVSHALADGAPSSIGLLVVALVGGVAVTAAFAWLLPVTRRRAMLVASLLGWTGGWLLADALTGAWGMPWTDTPVGWSQEHAAVGIVVGLLWGTATALTGMPARIVGDEMSDSEVATLATGGTA